MNILPYHIHNILKIYRDNGERSGLPQDRAVPPEAAPLASDRVDISEEGRKEQIKREIVDDIIRKIR